MDTLKAGLANVFKSQPGSPADAARGIADAYDTYCQAGLAAPGKPIFTGAEKKAFEGIILGALSLGDKGSSAKVAEAFSTALETYWMAPPVMFSGGPATGVVTAAPGAKAIIAPLTAALSNTENTEDLIAASIATQLDIATKTVLVTYSTPTPPAGPPPPATVV